MNLRTFYNRYHKKNSAYYKRISRQNFTYFYILNFLHLADLKLSIKGRILDIGCGVGTLALYLSQYAAQVVGIDISSRALKIARQAAKNNQVKNITYQLGEMTSRNHQYDLVLATEIIEHIKDEQKFAKDTYASLKNGGYLLLSTPSKHSLMFKWGWYRVFDQEVGHLRRYSCLELTKLLKSCGFKIVKVQENESLLRSLLFTTKLGTMIRFIRGPFIKLFHYFDEKIGRIFGFTDIIVLAKK